MCSPDLLTVDSSAGHCWSSIVASLSCPNWAGAWSSLRSTSSSEDITHAGGWCYTHHTLTHTNKMLQPPRLKSPQSWKRETEREGDSSDQWLPVMSKGFNWLNPPQRKKKNIQKHVREVQTGFQVRTSHSSTSAALSSAQTKRSHRHQSRAGQTIANEIESQWDWNRD